MSSGLKGIISALPTPFNNAQQIDTESLKKLVRFNIEQGMHGIYVGGSTG
ncbi:dihydrodipicolinate synthase family protein, partial [Escherichia coli]|nr:dihydrodipicolinate synthase family protein [Escherichia coli]